METPDSSNNNSSNSKNKNLFLHHPWFIGLTSSFIVSIVFFILSAKIGAVTESVKTTAELIVEIHQKLKNYDLKDGQTVQVGINNVDIAGNGIIVFSDNPYGLVEGDKVYLKNYLDDSYETTIKCIVQRTPKRNGDASRAEVFVTHEVAKRLCLLKPGATRWQGVYPVKLVKIPKIAAGGVPPHP